MRYPYSVMYYLEYPQCMVQYSENIIGVSGHISHLWQLEYDTFMYSGGFGLRYTEVPKTGRG